MRQSTFVIRWLGCALVLLCAPVYAQTSVPTTPAPTLTAEGPPELPAMIQWHATPGGVQYAEVLLGHGATPREGQTVVVHFNGWLDDGTQFDSTYKRGKPFGFALGSGQVIKGWDEGVRGMRPGGKRRLIVPAALGYGPDGVPNLVPPNATLLFDVELLRVLDTPPPPPAPPTQPRRRE